jgi:hypothetical protein
MPVPWGNWQTELESTDGTHTVISWVTIDDTLLAYIGDCCDTNKVTAVSPTFPTSGSLEVSTFWGGGSDFSFDFGLNRTAAVGAPNINVRTNVGGDGQGYVEVVATDGTNTVSNTSPQFSFLPLQYFTPGDPTHSNYAPFSVSYAETVTGFSATVNGQTVDVTFADGSIANATSTSNAYIHVCSNCGDQNLYFGNIVP